MFVKVSGIHIWGYMNLLFDVVGKENPCVACAGVFWSIVSLDRTLRWKENDCSFWNTIQRLYMCTLDTGFP